MFSLSPLSSIQTLVFCIFTMWLSFQTQLNCSHVLLKSLCAVPLSRWLKTARLCQDLQLRGKQKSEGTEKGGKPLSTLLWVTEAEVTWFTEQHLASPTICSRYAPTCSPKWTVTLPRTNLRTKECQVGNSTGEFQDNYCFHLFILAFLRIKQTVTIAQCSGISQTRTEILCCHCENTTCCRAPG